MDYFLDAQIVTLDRDEFTLVLGFSSGAADTPSYVLLQKSLNADEQDEALGMAGVHIQVDSEKRSGYNAVAGIYLRGDLLNITLRADARPLLRIDGDIQIKLPQAAPNLSAQLEAFAREIHGEFPFNLSAS